MRIDPLSVTRWSIPTHTQHKNGMLRTREQLAINSPNRRLWILTVFIQVVHIGGARRHQELDISEMEMSCAQSTEIRWQQVEVASTRNGIFVLWGTH